MSALGNVPLAIWGGDWEELHTGIVTDDQAPEWKPSTSLFDACETLAHIWMGSSRGRLLRSKDETGLTKTRSHLRPHSENRHNSKHISCHGRQKYFTNLLQRQIDLNCVVKTQWSNVQISIVLQWRKSIKVYSKYKNASWWEANEGSYCRLLGCGGGTVGDGSGGNGMGYYGRLMHCTIPVKLAAGREQKAADDTCHSGRACDTTCPPAGLAVTRAALHRELREPNWEKQGRQIENNKAHTHTHTMEHSNMGALAAEAKSCYDPVIQSGPGAEGSIITIGNDCSNQLRDTAADSLCRFIFPWLINNSIALMRRVIIGWWILVLHV